MGLSQVLTVAHRSTVLELKQLLAAGDPTGNTRISEISLAISPKSPSQPLTPLSDFTELTKRHAALDLLTASDLETLPIEPPLEPEAVAGVSLPEEFQSEAYAASGDVEAASFEAIASTVVSWPAEPVRNVTAIDESPGSALLALDTLPAQAPLAEVVEPAAVAEVAELATLPPSTREQNDDDDQTYWAPPPSEAWAFRLGEYLWCGAARLQEAPPGGFLPRRSFAALTLPPAGRLAASLLLMGGLRDDEAMNDVWRLSLPRLGAQRASDASGALAQPKWTEVSPQDVGHTNGQGQRVMRKWKGRSNFSSCAATSAKGYTLIYVVAGSDGGKNFLNDIWASEDGGANWVCMSRQASWQKRTAPGICALPERPDHIVLAGGTMKSGELFQDVWLSDDAGSTWVMLERPECLAATGRYRPALLPLAPRCQDDRGSARILLLGGCFIDGGDRGYASLERLMHDAWECTLDFASPDRSKAATWTCWGNIRDSRGSVWEPVGVDSFTCALDANNHTLAARLPSQDFLCVAKARAPPDSQESVAWYPLRPSQPSRVLVKEKPDGLPKADTEKLVFVRLSAAVPSLIPRLVVVTTREVLVSDDGEWCRQVLFMLLIGLRIGNSRGFPAELWNRRVMPAVLPSALAPVRRKTAPSRT